MKCAGGRGLAPLHRVDRAYRGRRDIAECRGEARTFLLALDRIQVTTSAATAVDAPLQISHHKMVAQFILCVNNC